MTWLSGVVAFIKLILAWLQKSHDEAERKAGRDEAIVAGQKREDDALAGTQGAIDESDKKPIEYRDEP